MVYQWNVGVRQVAFPFHWLESMYECLFEVIESMRLSLGCFLCTRYIATGYHNFLDFSTVEFSASRE
jgi:hypothetical protein